MIAIVASALWGRLQALAGIIGRYPLQAALIASLCLCGWLYKGKRDAIAARKADAVAFQTASDTARAEQAALRARERQAYQDQAHDADQRYLSRASDARSTTRDFIARNRVQPNAGCRPAVAIGQADPAGLPAPVPADVIVAETDVHACGDLYAYSVAAREWALTVAE